MTGSSCRSSCVVHRVASVEHGVSSGQVEYRETVSWYSFFFSFMTRNLHGTSLSPRSRRRRAGWAVQGARNGQARLPGGGAAAAR